MGDTKIEILNASKTLLGITDDGSDCVLELLIDDVIDAVSSYCRIETLPRQLVSFIPTLVARQYHINAADGVKSVTEGERRIEMTDENYDFLSEYTQRLKPFVSRSVKLPSSVTKEENDEKSFQQVL